MKTLNLGIILAIVIAIAIDEDLDVVRMYKKTGEGKLEQINPFSSFWFSWATVHPGTDLYR